MHRVPSLGLYLLIAFTIFFYGAQNAAFAQTPSQKPPLVRVELIAEKASIAPGDTVTVALRQTIRPRWHTYWSNPGDSGEPTQIHWKLPEGVSAGPIQWPVPHAIPVGPLMNFGYSDEVVLLTDIIVPQTISAAALDIAADVKWLVCEEICVPEEASVRLSLSLLGGTVTPRPSPNASIIAAARKTLPEPAPWAAKFHARADGVALKVENLSGRVPSDAKVHFFPLDWGKIENAAPQRAAFEDGNLLMRLAPGELAASAGAVPLAGVLAVETRGAGGSVDRQGYSISAAASELPIALPAITAQLVPAAPPESLSLPLALGFAFLGGLILNLMPCVFPVLSLKAFSLARDAGDARRRRAKGLAYLGGVLASFAAIGIAIVALRTGGSVIGWGMQFQSPTFVLAMMALFLALALNLSGVFIIGSSVAGLGDGLTRRAGLAGYFFTGVLATVVATPCTAPFMGAAIGYAFTQPAPTVFAVLLALGLGFALPIVLLSLSPALGRWMPKPGMWMETFKQLMAFPLYATAGWLLWVLSVQQGSDGVVAGLITLLGVAFAAWLLGRTQDMTSLRGGVAAVIAFAAVGLGAASLPATAPQGASFTARGDATGGPVAERFTSARLAELVGQNKPVFVNLTAAWCITCKVNERVALRSESVAAAFATRGIVYLVGDWTNRDPEITALLQAHGRAGVPLYLLYSGVPNAAPDILPQLLTEGMVLSRIAGLAPSPNKQAKGDL